MAPMTVSTATVARFLVTSVSAQFFGNVETIPMLPRHGDMSAERLRRLSPELTDRTQPSTCGGAFRVFAATYYTP